MLKSELKAEEYRARARAASLAADGAPLARTKEQHQLAARTWSDLAAAEEARAAGSRARRERQEATNTEQPQGTK
ncbi:MAG: hypothetical protein ACK41C_00780 [Phenylobacterium sp.]|uniref:hypothetical protein n=1 Tax=Phenylobacterium sp. TaxID=1871053 RepID=UPI003918F7BC